MEAIKAIESLSLNEKYEINIPKEPFYYDLESQIEATIKNLPSRLLRYKLKAYGH